MLLTIALLAANQSPAAGAIRASDHGALSRGEVVIRTEKVKGVPLKLVRAVALIDAPPARVFKVIDNCSGYKRFMPRTTLSRERRRRGKIVDCEVHVELPMFFGTLRSVTRGVHTAGPKVWSRAWTLVSGTYDHNVGRWTIQPYRGNPKLSVVEYAIHAVPQVSLPDAILARANGSAVVNLLKTIRKQVTGSETRRR